MYLVRGYNTEKDCLVTIARCDSISNAEMIAKSLNEIKWRDINIEVPLKRYSVSDEVECAGCGLKYPARGHFLLSARD